MSQPKLSYANIAATLALFFALGGSALAAKHYVITSTKQIKPSVLKQLRGQPGSEGPQGAAGDRGTTGPTGAKGTDGTNGTNGVNGTNGINGSNGADGTARAYAAIALDGTLIASESKNAVSSHRPPATDGYYCVQFAGGITPSNSLTFAMVRAFDNVNVQNTPGAPDCAAGEFEFRIYDSENHLFNEELMVMIP